MRNFANFLILQHREMKHIQVVCAVIVNEGEVLCMQRPFKGSPSTAGKWEFPGGKIEPGESAEQALARELREEMDYEVVIQRHLTTVYHEYTDFHITMQAFLCTATTRAFNRKEHISHIWLTPSQMPTLDWAAADAPILAAIAQEV